MTAAPLPEDVTREELLRAVLAERFPTAHQVQQEARRSVPHITWQPQPDLIAQLLREGR